MAFSHGSQARIYAGAVDMSPYFRNYSYNGTAETADTSAFGTKARTYVQGMYSSTLEASGLYDGTGPADEWIRDTFGGSTVVVLEYQRNGDTYVMDSIETAYNITADIGDAVTFTVSFQNSNATTGGVIVKPHGTESSDGTSDGVQTGVVPPGKGTVWLLTEDDADLASVTVEESVDNQVWAATHSWSSIAGAGQFKQEGVDTRGYVRVVWSGTGTFMVVHSKGV